MNNSKEKADKPTIIFNFSIKEIAWHLLDNKQSTVTISGVISSDSEQLAGAINKWHATTVIKNNERISKCNWDSRIFSNPSVNINLTDEADKQLNDFLKKLGAIKLPEFFLNI